MNEIIATPSFRKGYKRIAKKYPSFKQDIANLLASLSENALQGIETMPNVRKIRLSITAKTQGKRGGARLIIYVRIEKSEVWLMYLYDKAEIEDIPDHEIKSFVAELLSSFDDDKRDKE